jgi:DsbC/DsbD-like thiol-disulfide interchange protein
MHHKVKHKPMKKMHFYLIVCIAIQFCVFNYLPVYAAQTYKDIGEAELKLASPGGLTNSDGTIDVALEIKLDSGWKTYWKHPGPLGLVPELDASGSTNLQNLEISFPTPIAFEEGDTLSAGYKDRTLWLLSLMPEQKNKPIKLILNIEMGLCETLCIPANAQLRLTIDPNSPRDSDAAQLVREAKASLPVLHDIEKPEARNIQISESDETRITLEGLGDTPVIFWDGGWEGGLSQVNNGRATLKWKIKPERLSIILPSSPTNKFGKLWIMPLAE